MWHIYYRQMANHHDMPEKKTIKRANQAKREGKSASTQASEFVREEIENIREGKHGARSAKQAIAIGLSKARRAGVKLRPPKKGQASAKTIKSAKQALRKGQKHEPVSTTRSRATVRALKREGKASVSRQALRVRRMQLRRRGRHHSVRRLPNKLRRPRVRVSARKQRRRQRVQERVIDVELDSI